MRFFVTTCCLLLSAFALRGQQTEKDSILTASWQARKIVGINLSPLLMQFVPFNRSNPRLTGPFQMRFKRYGPNGRAFRFSLGLTPILFEDDGQTASINLGFGVEKRRAISQRWSYTRGFDFLILGGTRNIPGNSNNNEFALGLGPMWGVEYAIAKRITIGTEAALNLGFSFTNEIIVFEILPPVGLFLHYYL